MQAEEGGALLETLPPHRERTAEERAGYTTGARCFTEPDISPLCGSQMKYSSSAFIAQVEIHPCDGTIRREMRRACVL